MGSCATRTANETLRYWGKRDSKLNLPTNSSLSVTLSQKSLRTHTTASCSSSYSGHDTLILNNEEEDIQSSARTTACLQLLKRYRKDLEDKDSGLPKLSSMPLRIVSANNFPTAAGLASSAAGFAALVRAIANLYELPHTPTQLSLVARQGSGSACRSMMGGYVAWRAGSATDGSDSVAEQVASISHWPEMRALILVVSADKKGVASTAGMQTTVETSSLFPIRADEIVPKRMKEMEDAIHARDFPTFARLTMQDSNSFHAVCLDSWPPIHYLNDVSRAAMNVVETINRRAGELVAAYTFDAGPNPVIYYLAQNSNLVAGVFKYVVQYVPGWDSDFAKDLQPNPRGGLESKSHMTIKAGVSRVICTGVGDGPQQIDEHLVDEQGKPVQVE